MTTVLAVTRCSYFGEFPADSDCDYDTTCAQELTKSEFHLAHGTKKTREKTEELKAEA